MANFEIISKYKDKNIKLPERKTQFSAGYDFEVAEDIIIPAFDQDKMWSNMATLNDGSPCLNNFLNDRPITLEDMSYFTKQTKNKPTLVPTGIKAKLDYNQYLELFIRSSCPLKYWLVLANGVGIIDADYYNNPNNEGHIFFQIINLSPFDIQLKKGDIIGQGIIKYYDIVDNDTAAGVREGGFGSTNN